MSTSPSDPVFLGLRHAKQRSDVRRLIETFGTDSVGEAWKQLDPCAQASLQLCRFFDGIIVTGPGQNGPASQGTPDDQAGDHLHLEAAERSAEAAAEAGRPA